MPGIPAIVKRHAIERLAKLPEAKKAGQTLPFEQVSLLRYGAATRELSIPDDGIIVYFSPKQTKEDAYLFVTAEQNKVHVYTIVRDVIKRHRVIVPGEPVRDFERVSLEPNLNGVCSIKARRSGHCVIIDGNGRRPSPHGTLILYNPNKQLSKKGNIKQLENLSLERKHLVELFDPVNPERRLELASNVQRRLLAQIHRVPTNGGALEENLQQTLDEIALADRIQRAIDPLLGLRSQSLDRQALEYDLCANDPGKYNPETEIYLNSGIYFRFSQKAIATRSAKYLLDLLRKNLLCYCLLPAHYRDTLVAGYREVVIRVDDEMNGHKAHFRPATREVGMATQSFAVEREPETITFLAQLGHEIAHTVHETVPNRSLNLPPGLVTLARKIVDITTDKYWGTLTRHEQGVTYQEADPQKRIFGQLGLTFTALGESEILSNTLAVFYSNNRTKMNWLFKARPNVLPVVIDFDRQLILWAQKMQLEPPVRVLAPLI